MTESNRWTYRKRNSGPHHSMATAIDARSEGTMPMSAWRLPQFHAMARQAKVATIALATEVRTEGGVPIDSGRREVLVAKGALAKASAQKTQTASRRGAIY